MVDFRKALEEKRKQKKYHVWMEGYRATGQSSDATYLGSVWATDFKAACELALKLRNWDMDYYDSASNTYWGCRFFDNEAKAREVFG